MLTHRQLWAALDALAERLDISPSALARMAGLDPTSFNRSKRLSSDMPPRPRWPSTESLAKVLAATGVRFADFAALATDGASKARRGVPLIGLAQAGRDGWFDDAGYPLGEGWDELEAPAAIEGAYALEISGESMAPLYRPGDRVVVRPLTEAPRRGDRVVVKTTGGEVMAKEVARITAKTLVLRSINPDFADRTLARGEVAWMARIVWVTQ